MIRLVMLATLIVPVATALPANADPLQLPTLAPDPQRCLVPAEFAVPDEALPAVAAAIRQRQLEILAIGAASTVGADQGAIPSFPVRVADRLRARLPGVTVTLTVRGGRGIAATEMVAAIREELSHRHPALVMWQTGTVEAVRGIRPDEFAQTLEEGASLVKAAGADLVLIDQQFSRFLRANADVDPYRQAMRSVAAIPGVVLFERYETMRGWASDGRIDLEHTEQRHRAEAIASLHDCLGLALSDYILAGVAATPP